MGITGICKDIVEVAEKIPNFWGAHMRNFPMSTYSIYVDALNVACNDVLFRELESTATRLLTTPPHQVEVYLWIIFDNFWTLKDLAPKTVGKEAQRAREPQLYERNMGFQSDKFSKLVDELTRRADGRFYVHWGTSTINADFETANRFAFTECPHDTMKILFSSDGDVLLQSLLNLTAIPEARFSSPVAFVSPGRGKRVEVIFLPEGVCASDLLKKIASLRGIDAKFLELYAGMSSTLPEYDHIERETWRLTKPECLTNPFLYASPHMTDLDQGFETVHYALSQGEQDYSDRYWEAILSTFVENIYWGISSSEEETEIHRMNRQAMVESRFFSAFHQDTHVPSLGHSSVPVSRMTNIPPEFCYNVKTLVDSQPSRVTNAIVDYCEIIQFMAQNGGRFPPGTQMCVIRSKYGSYLYLRLKKRGDSPVRDATAHADLTLRSDEHARAIILEHLSICEDERNDAVPSRSSGGERRRSQSLGYYLDGLSPRAPGVRSKIFDNCATRACLYMSKSSRCLLISRTTTPEEGLVSVWEYY